MPVPHLYRQHYRMLSDTMREAYTSLPYGERRSVRLTIEHLANKLAEHNPVSFKINQFLSECGLEPLIPEDKS